MALQAGDALGLAGVVAFRFDIDLPSPPRWLRRGPFRADAFRRGAHDERTAVVIGRLLGGAFLVCFLTGLVSHLMQHEPQWLDLPSRPVWGYRVTQGLHVATGILAVPLLLAKLHTVYPRLFDWPPARSVGHALERISVFVLVAGAGFELVTGLLNIAQWYPWRFPFTQTHYLVGWITIGALLVHVGVKAPQISRSWRRVRAARADELTGPSRRGVLATLGIAVGVVSLTTLGDTVPWLRSLDLLAPREVGAGPQRLPVNRTAAQARVAERALDPAYRLRVLGPRPYSLSPRELAALPQHTAELPIACVEGWSTSARWSGVRVADLLRRAGAPPGCHARVVSLEQTGAYRFSELDPAHAWDELTLLASRVNGEVLDLDHGYPLRLIAPDRPGVLQTKWVEALEVVA